MNARQSIVKDDEVRSLLDKLLAGPARILAQQDALEAAMFESDTYAADVEAKDRLANIEAETAFLIRGEKNGDGKPIFATEEEQQAELFQRCASNPKYNSIIAAIDSIEAMFRGAILEEKNEDGTPVFTEATAIAERLTTLCRNDSEYVLHQKALAKLKKDILAEIKSETNGDGKPLYTNEEQRNAATRIACNKDPEYIAALAEVTHGQRRRAEHKMHVGKLVNQVKHATNEYYAIKTALEVVAGLAVEDVDGAAHIRLANLKALVKTMEEM